MEVFTQVYQVIYERDFRGEDYDIPVYTAVLSLFYEAGGSIGVSCFLQRRIDPWC